IRGGQRFGFSGNFFAGDRDGTLARRWLALMTGLPGTRTLDEAAVVFRHARERDDARPPLSRAEPLASVKPGIFPVRQIAEPLGGPVAVVSQDSVDALPLLVTELFRVALLPGINLELAPVFVVESRYHRTVRPGLDPILEQRLVVPDERPGLGVVDQFLQLHGGHLALTA